MNTDASDTIQFEIEFPSACSGRRGKIVKNDWDSVEFEVFIRTAVIVTVDA